MPNSQVLSKILQTNTTLQSLSWDENSTGYQGLSSFYIGLQLNKSLSKMPLPIVDVSQAIRENSDKLKKLQQLVSDIERKISENGLPKTPETTEVKPKEEEITQIKAPDFLVKKVPNSISQRHIVSEHRASIDAESPFAQRAMESAKKSVKKPDSEAPLNKSYGENQMSPSVSPKSHVDYQKELTRIVGDKKLAVVFREFLHQCFNSENFSFWLEVEDFKTLSENPTLMKERAEFLVQKYFSRNSEFEINVDGTLKSQILAEVAQDAKVSTFDKAQQAIWHLMVQDCGALQDIIYLMNSTQILKESVVQGISGWTRSH